MSDPVEIPEWIATLVGSLRLENEMLRRALAEQQTAPPSEPPHEGGD